MKKSIIATCLLASLFATAQPVLVKDIYIGSNGSNIQNFLSYSNNLAFSARDSTGTYWYQSNGTTAGTTQITQLSSLHAVSFKAFGGKLLFSGDPTGGTNIEPWVTDGTPGGMVVLKDVNPGFGGSTTKFIGDLGSNTFMSSMVGTGYRIYKTDGTPAGTILLFSTPAFYKSIVFNNKIYFWGMFNSVDGLWSFDASSTQPSLIAKQTNSVYDFAVASATNSFYYVAKDSLHGYEPWVSDGTVTGTHMLKDINPGTANSCDDGSSSSWTSFAILNNKLYFNPTEPTHGRELWVSDGTISGTVLFNDIVSGSTGSNLRNIVATSNKLYFGARISGYNYDLIWVCDETISGTKVLLDNTGNYIEDGGKYSFNSKAFIIGRNTSNQILGFEPYISDGTNAGSYMLANIDSAYTTNPNPYGGSMVSTPMPFIIGTTIYFVANDGFHGAELWKYTDGLSTGLLEIKTSFNLTIYPNPANNELNISATNKIAKVEVYNLTGQLQSSSNKNKVDVSDLSSGIYFVKAYSEDGVATQKFIKQ